MADKTGKKVLEEHLLGFISGIFTLSLHRTDNSQIDEKLLYVKYNATHDRLEILGGSIEFAVPQDDNIKSIRLNNYSESGSKTITHTQNFESTINTGSSNSYHLLSYNIKLS